MKMHGSAYAEQGPQGFYAELLPRLLVIVGGCFEYTEIPYSCFIYHLGASVAINNQDHCVGTV